MQSPGTTRTNTNILEPLGQILTFWNHSVKSQKPLGQILLFASILCRSTTIYQQKYYIIIQYYHLSQYTMYIIVLLVQYTMYYIYMYNSTIDSTTLVLFCTFVVTMITRTTERLETILLKQQPISQISSCCLLVLVWKKSRSEVFYTTTINSIRSLHFELLNYAYLLFLGLLKHQLFTV